MEPGGYRVVRWWRGGTGSRSLSSSRRQQTGVERSGQHELCRGPKESSLAQGKTDHETSEEAHQMTKKSPSQLPPVSLPLIFPYTTHSLSHDQPKGRTRNNILDLFSGQD